MYRIQLLLDEAHHEFLEEQARERDSSMSAVMRELIDGAIRASRQGPAEEDPLWETVGAGQGGRDRASEQHDRILGEMRHERGAPPPRRSKRWRPAPASESLTWTPRRWNGSGRPSASTLILR